MVTAGATRLNIYRLYDVEDATATGTQGNKTTTEVTAPTTPQRSLSASSADNKPKKKLEQVKLTIS